MKTMMETIRQAGVIAISVFIAAPAYPLSVGRSGTAIPRASVVPAVPAGAVLQPVQAALTAPSFSAIPVPGPILPSVAFPGAEVVPELPVAPALDLPQPVLSGFQQMTADTPVEAQTAQESPEAGAQQGTILFDGAAELPEYQAAPVDVSAADEDFKPYPIVFKMVARTHIEGLRSETLSSRPQAGETVAAAKARFQERISKNLSWDLILLDDVQDPIERETYELVHARFLPVLKRVVENAQGGDAQAYAQVVRRMLDAISAAVQRGDTIDAVMDSVEQARRDGKGVTLNP